MESEVGFILEKRETPPDSCKDDNLDKMHPMEVL